MKVVFSVILFSLSIILSGQNNFNYYFNRGQEKYEKRNYSGAAADFTSALKKRKTAKNDYLIANAYRARALCKMYQKKYNNALDDIADAIKLKPEYSELYLTRSLIHMRNKQYDESVDWADKGLELKPEFEELILLKVKAKLLQKRYATALDIIDTVLLKINPRNPEAWNLKGSIKQHQKEYEECIKAYSRSIEIDAQDNVAFYDRGVCKAYLKDFDGAQADMNRGMEIDSTQKWIGFNNIAFFIKFEQKDYAGSISLLDQAIKLNPTFAYAYNNRGYAKLQLNDIKGAREDITKSLKLDEENSYVYKTYAQLLLAEKKDKQACENLNKAIELDYTDDYDEDVNDLIKEYCK